MVQSVEFDLRQAVLVNGPFGPAEVRHMEAAIIRDRTNYAILRDAVAELQAKEEPTPASMVRLGTCLYLLGRCYRAIEVLKQGDGGAMAHFYLGRCHVARQQYDQAVESYQAAERAGYDAGQCALARAEALRYAGKARRGPGRAGRPLRGHRADGRVPGPAGRHRGRPGRKPQRSGGPLRAGRRGRPRPPRRPVRPGRGKRPPRQRRRWPWNCTSGPPPASPPSSAR